MRRIPTLRRTIRIAKRGITATMPEVPTFDPLSERKPPNAAPPKLEQDAADEAVRRMVEAAYT